APKPTVVESKHVDAQFQPGLIKMHPMTDVPGVAVQQQNDLVPSRRSWIGAEKPSVQPRPIGRRETHFLERTPQFRRTRLKRPGRHIDLSMLKPANHGR